MIYANDFAPIDDKLRVYFLGHPMHDKSDSFVISYGRELYLIDGGVSLSFETVEFLLSLRKKWLGERKSLFYNQGCKIRINQIVSHFHGDHVESLLQSVVSSPFIDYSDVYLTEPVKTPEGYENCGKNGDLIYRPVFLDLLKERHPNHKIHIIPFGKENTLSLKTATGFSEEVEILLCPSPVDPSGKEYFAYMLDTYSKIADDKFPGNLMSFIMNGASMWVKVSFGGKAILFTGDSTKKSDETDYESCDIMTKTYKEMLGDISVLKFVHHGYNREFAVPAMMSFESEYMVLTTQIENVSDTMLKHDPNTKIKIVNSGRETALFTCSSDGELTLEMQ